jgi:hypothetical protein
MMQEPESRPGPGNGPATAREAAKEFLHAFALLGWTVESIPTRANSMGWEAQRGGTVEDEAGQPRQLTDRQLAITRLGTSRCYAIFEIPELYIEIQREANQDEEAARCLFCNAPLDKSRGPGRARVFCDNKNKCKQAYHRQQEREQRRADTLQQHEALRQFWQEHHIDEGTPLLDLLQNILIDQGEEAARAATEAILSYAQAQDRRARAAQPEQEKTSRNPRKPRKPEA